MGCVASRIDKEERVRICKERKRLMKQLLGYRKEFADAQLAYLRSLRNTGVTLRQFTESESLEVEEIASGIEFPLSPPPPPPPLPPSPPPPPSFSPDSRKCEDKPAPAQSAVEEIIEIDEESAHTPPHPLRSSSWEYWDLFGSVSPQCVRNTENKEQDDEEEEENWADADMNSEFTEENEETNAEFIEEDEVNLLSAKQQISELDDTLLANEDMPMVVLRRKKSLAGIIKDLDEYFLMASDMVKDIAILIDVDRGESFLQLGMKENKRKRSNSAKVFSSLTWSWSSKSLQSTKKTGDFSGSCEPCRPGAHCLTLQKLYSEEQKLYKNVKEQEIAKVEYGRKSALLQRQEQENDRIKADKTRSAVETLESCILSREESIEQSCSNIAMFINEELQPQLIALASGMMHMWRTMHKYHEIQNQISQLLNHVKDQQSVDPTTEYLQQAAAQLQREVTSWCHSFCNLVKFQCEYVKTLCEWTELSNRLQDIEGPQSRSSLMVHALLKKWMQSLDKLPDKMVSEAINSLLSTVNAIAVQLQEELNMHKRSEKLVRRLEHELTLVSEMEMKLAGSFSREDESIAITSKHPLTIKRAKLEVLKRQVDDEKAKYKSSVKMMRVRILNNLQTSLPKVFQALMVYSSAYAQSFEVILDNATVSQHGNV